MSADIINLRRHRRRKRREDLSNEAAENRIKHGISAKQKAAGKAETSRLDRHLAGHKRNDPEPKA
jgi:hypothetical protein